MQILGQEEVKSFLSEQIQSQMALRFEQGRCRCEPVGPVWKELLDSISELLTHHLQQVAAPHHTISLSCPNWKSNLPSTAKPAGHWQNLPSQLPADWTAALHWQNLRSLSTWQNSARILPCIGMACPLS